MIFTKTNKYLTLFTLLFICLTIFSCKNESNPLLDLNETNLIPKPISVEAIPGSFQIQSSTKIYYDQDENLAAYLADLLKPATGFNLATASSTDKNAKNSIHLSVDTTGDASSEAYQIDVNNDHVTISSSSSQGVFNGIQTLRQMLPPAIEKSEKQSGPWYIPTGKISDQPEYGYRGSMLDVARHFFGVDDVKRYIDLIAQYKINHLHLHLTDDQGWRIEIKSWPNLTTHGGSTEVGGGKGGFFTQEDYKEIVSYAASRYITIIPEIDMPGHTNAALASYPELTCDGKAPDLYTGTEVGFSTFCTSKEIVYKFVDDVIREISEMTPGPYFHVGGDESHVTAMEDYIPFINRVSKIAEKYGKKVIGWDEVAHAELPENSTVHYWNVAKNAKMGVDQGAKVLMSPATKTYLDMQYDTTTRIGLHWAAYIEVDSAYLWEPSKMVEGINKENILGFESPLWTETVETMDDIEYLVFPRIICHSEVGCTPSEERNWDEFKVRLGEHKPRMDNQGIDFYHSALVPWKEEEKEEFKN